MKLKRVKIDLLLSMVLIMVFIFSSINTQAQITGNINYSMFYTDNPYRLTDGSEEFVNTYMANLGYQPFKNNFNLSYTFGLNDFRNITDRSYNYHSFGLEYSFKSASSAREDNISLGAAYTLKQNNTGDALYKFNNYNLNANGQFYLTDNLLLVSGYKFNYKNYPSLYNLTYTDNIAFSRLSKFFETNTALHLELQLGDRNYSIKDMTSLTSKHGKMGGMGKRTNTKTTNVTDLLTTFKVSQSIFENTGINLYYSNRISLNKKSSISLTEFMYSDDEDLWDDPYSFEGHDIGSEFIQILPWDMSLRLSGQYSNRRYKENLIDTLGILSQRMDNRTELWFGITKELNEIPLLNSLELSLEYMHIINNSNENYFTYKNNLVLFKIGINF